MSAVGNVGRVLRLFTPERSMLSVTEVAQLLRLPKSSTSRLLKAMSSAGLLALADRSAGYCVGNLIFETSRRHRAHSTLSVHADEVLARIAKSTGHTGYVAMQARQHFGGIIMDPANRTCQQVAAATASSVPLPSRTAADLR